MPTSPGSRGDARLYRLARLDETGEDAIDARGEAGCARAESGYSRQTATITAGEICG